MPTQLLDSARVGTLGRAPGVNPRQTMPEAQLLWFVAHTRPRCEKKLVRDCEREGVPATLPCYRAAHQYFLIGNLTRYCVRWKRIWKYAWLRPLERACASILKMGRSGEWKAGSKRDMARTPYCYGWILLDRRRQ